MRIKTDPVDIFGEAQKIIEYNQSIDLYEKVKNNENFFIGNQWEGVNAPDLEKPVLNILKRVVSYFISTIVSDDISAQVSLFGGKADPDTEIMLKIVSAQFDQIMEAAKIKFKNRSIIKSAAVDGDGCLYFFYDVPPEEQEVAENSEAAALPEVPMGKIEAEEIDNTNILFGNPQVQDVQRQPYIIIQLRRTVEEVKEEAQANGISRDQIDLITEDNDPNGINTENETGKVTLYLKFWKERGTVSYTKTTQNVIIKNKTDLGYRLYPISYFSWDRVKNSFHGQSCITSLIDNQIFINKLFAMSMEHVKRMAFPKIVYNGSAITKWTNKVGEAIKANGQIDEKIVQKIDGTDMSAQVIQLIEKTISYTRDTMGASDAALGNIRPDNTSAIIAVQKSTQMPLELQRMDFYQFVEDCCRIFLDIMRVDYGLREVSYTDADGNSVTGAFDFSVLDSLNVKLNVDVGASAYWSEIMQVQTIDNLYKQHVINDPITYLESIPDGYIFNKSKLIERVKEQNNLKEQVKALTAQLQALQGGGGNGLVPGMQNGNGIGTSG
ncbi:hypothetical protein [Marasmitruncus massiliensis]|uniref:portal protein n=1 Tax=Marasmitruncus massiliensis TaxID=1944642 RepID=UPI000C7B79C7|nr:hypothetical protein [Marasmitruncus massiliensis]